MRRKLKTLFLSMFISISMAACAPLSQPIENTTTVNSVETQENTNGNTMEELPTYQGSPYVQLNENHPNFTDEEKTRLDAFETYSDLDNLGRCGVAFANICQELMPTEERQSISDVHPSGWHNGKYDFVDGGWVFNRCHLIGFQLAAENDNEKNLITGTRYMNVEGMLPFENMVADYVKETNNHVLYRVTPIFQGDELVARGVELEAWSVEDNGDGICFHVYCFNVQQGVVIDYATGENRAEGLAELPKETTENTTESIDECDDGQNNDAQAINTYVVNTNTNKFHRSTCSSITRMKDENKLTMEETREEMIEKGYEACKQCNP